MYSSKLSDGIFEVNQIDNVLYQVDGESDTLVIRLHGLPGRSPQSEKDLLGKSLTDAGICYFAFDFQGIRDSGGYYTYRNSLHLAKQVIDYFALEHDTIFSKIGLYAESFGGSIAVHLAKTSSIISSLFLWSPVLNFEVLSKEIKMSLIVKFMQDSGVIRLPVIDDMEEAISEQIRIYAPENDHDVFSKIPTKILTSGSDLLFSPYLIKRELDPKYHDIIEIQDNLDHNLVRNNSAIRVSEIATDFFRKVLS